MNKVADFVLAKSKRGNLPAKMLICTCPKCSHKFQVLEARILEGSNVTCGKCSYTVKILLNKEVKRENND